MGVSNVYMESDLILKQAHKILAFEKMCKNWKLQDVKMRRTDLKPRLEESPI
jgi:hypothetical protein